jgi:hypothetical protein
MIRLDRSRSWSRHVTLTFCHGAIFSVIIFTFFCFFLKPVWILFTSAYFSSSSASSRKTKRCVDRSLVVVYIAMNGSWSFNLHYREAAPSLACVLITRFTQIHTWHLHTGTSSLFWQRPTPLLWAVGRTAHVQITVSGKRNGQNCYVISVVYVSSRWRSGMDYKDFR